MHLQLLIADSLHSRCLLEALRLLGAMIWLHKLGARLAGGVQVIGLVLVDGIVVTLGHGQEKILVTIGTHFVQQACEVPEPGKHLITNVGIHPVDARSKLAAATLDWKRIL